MEKTRIVCSGAQQKINIRRVRESGSRPERSPALPSTGVSPPRR